MPEDNLLVVVADCRRARIYRNSGAALAPNLELPSNFEQKNPPTYELGGDKLGSIFELRFQS